jgi:N-acetylglucosamine-6-phosphate deacetylase
LTKVYALAYNTTMKQLCLHGGRIFTGVTTIENGSVLIKDGLIEDVVSEERFKKMAFPSDTEFIELNGQYVTPGFIDTHIHGMLGYDTARGEEEDFLGISEHLVRFGVTSFCPTLYPQQEEQMINSIRNGTLAMGHEQGARIQGLHLEGPFISCNQLGVQRPETIKDVDIDFMREMYKASRGSISIMTVAPELKGMRDLAHYCIRKGIVLSAGHSDANYDNMMEGVQSGILHCTHMFNAMRKMHHRDPGLVGAILIHEDLSCELIADGIHVHPALIKLLLRDKPTSKIILVTDALAPTGIMDKTQTMTANGEEVYLGDDGIFHRKKDDVIAGSALTLDKAVRNMLKWGSSLDDTLRMAATNPANLLKQQDKIGYLLPGFIADVVVLDQTMHVARTYVNGQLRYENL